MQTKIFCLLVDKRYSEKERLQKDFGDVNFFIAGDGKTLDKELYNHVDIIPPTNRQGSYPAFLKRNNSYNAFLCFRKIVNIAKNCNYEHILILEDDATKELNFDEIFEKAWKDLNEHDPDWHMFYLGANHTFSPTHEITPNLLRLTCSGCWHCVMLSNRIYDTILSLPMRDPIDGVSAQEIHKLGHSYACWPNISLPKPGFSYCEGSNQDYRHFFKNKGSNWK